MPEQPLVKYLERRDLLKAINNMEVKQGTSKEGNLYYYVEITLINGFKPRIFINSQSTFGWCNAFDLIDADNQINF